VKPGVLDIVIRNATFSDAGTYVCEEPAGSKAAALLGVIGTRQIQIIIIIIIIIITIIMRIFITHLIISLDCLSSSVDSYLQ